MIKDAVRETSLPVMMQRFKRIKYIAEISFFQLLFGEERAIISFYTIIY